MSSRTYDGGQVVEEWDDETRTYGRIDKRGEWQTRHYDEVEAAPLVEAEKAEALDVAREALLDSAGAALAANLDYLAMDLPTSAERAAQVAELTRQAVTLLRLVGGRIEDTGGAVIEEPVVDPPAQGEVTA